MPLFLYVLDINSLYFKFLYVLSTGYEILVDDIKMTEGEPTPTRSRRHPINQQPKKSILSQQMELTPSKQAPTLFSGGLLYL